MCPHIRRGPPYLGRQLRDPTGHIIKNLSLLHLRGLNSVVGRGAEARCPSLTGPGLRLDNLPRGYDPSPKMTMLTHADPSGACPWGSPTFSQPPENRLALPPKSPDHQQLLLPSLGLLRSSQPHGGDPSAVQGQASLSLGTGAQSPAHCTAAPSGACRDTQRALPECPAGPVARYLLLGGPEDILIQTVAQL